MACAGSTDPGAAGAFDLSRPYELHPDVSLRPEPFGALAYHYGNRRLTFLKSNDLVRVVSALAAHASAAAALEAAGVALEATGVRSRAAMERALASLAASEVIRAR